MADTGHSRFGGSIIGRVIACPGSVALCATVPNLSSSYAEEGTLAHALAEHMLREQESDAMAHVGGTVDGKLDSPQFTEDMCRAVQVYIDTVAADFDALPDDAEIFVEQKFVLDIDTAETGEVFGSNDCLLYSPSAKKLIIYDYKHGAGVPVSVENNSQLKFYALGAIDSHPDWMLESVELVIVQPRARDDEGNGVKRWPVDVIDLFTFKGEVAKAVAEAKSPDPVVHSGDHCRWCPAKATCPLVQQEALAAFDGVEIDNVKASDLPDPKTLDTDRISAILTNGAKLIDWINEVQKFAEAYLMSGGEVPGFKLVQKIGRRKWIDSDEEVAAFMAMNGLGEDIVRPRKLITLTEAERLLKQAKAGKDTLEALELNYTLKESSGYTMAAASDRRPAINLTETAFKDVNL